MEWGKLHRQISHIEGQFGGGINWQHSSNLTANITVNPDFATVEADEDVIDLTKHFH